MSRNIESRIQKYVRSSSLILLFMTRNISSLSSNKFENSACIMGSGNQIKPSNSITTLDQDNSYNASSNYTDRISCLINTAYDTPKQITVMAMRLIRWGMTT